MVDQSGERIKGYRLLERIGTGGFGAVYKSSQSTLGREVAIKVILPGFSNHPDFIRRFEIEAQVVARLEHLHIVPLYDYWRDPSGAYLVMRWMKGGSLAEFISNSPLNLQQAATMLDQIASGLAAAHRLGVIHRDIKPSNILLDEEGNAYLTDFGIASGIGPEQDDIFLDRVLGSPAYISPEQARNESVTPQADIYCLGLTLYEMLTGSHPFSDLTTVEQFFEQINTSLPVIENLEPSLGSAVNELIQVATAKDPNLRFRDPLEMAAAFRKAAQVEIDAPLQDPLESLTKREIEIWRMIADSKSNKEIARELYVELSTVKWHITQLYRKLDVRTRVQAIKLARETAYLSSLIPDREGDQTRYNTASLLVSELKNPYKGLQPFDYSDSHNFFGREDLIRRLLERLSARNDGGCFLALVGPSGCGKSSLVKAGLLPSLWKGGIEGSQNWFTVEMTPGKRPLEELEVALTRVAADQSENIHKQLRRDRNGLLRTASLILPRDETKLVLFIDQFEELFSLVTDQAEIKEFIDLLSNAIQEKFSRVVILITLRADYYDRPLQFPEFGELMRHGLEPVLPLTVEELERAINQPALKQGVQFEPGLVARIIEDVRYQPAALPLLQHALMELFDLIQDRLLTQSAYVEIGGTVGAVAKRAENLYQEMLYPYRQAVKDLFLRLVLLDEDHKKGGRLPAGRIRQSREEILEVAEEEEIMEEVIDAFSAYRLLSLDHDPDTRQPTVELAHEALIAEWDRYSSWVEEYSFDLLNNRRLQSLAADWEENERDSSFLLHGSRLEQAASWVDESDFQLSPATRQFIDESLGLKESKEAEESLRRERELDAARKLAESERQRAEEGFQSARRLKKLVVGIAAALGTAIILAGLAFAAYRSAETNRMVAESRELAAAAVGQLETDPELALLLALESVSEDTIKDLPRPREAIQALHEAVQAARFRKVIHSQEAKIHSGFFMPGGDWILVTYADGSAVIMDFRSEEILKALEGHSALITQVAFHPELDLMATCSRDHTALIWNSETGEFLQEISDANQIFSCDFHPQKPQLITVGNSITANLWNADDGELIQTFYGHSDYISDVEFSPDGSYLVTSSLDETIKIWDLEGGYVIKTLIDHGDRVQNIAFDKSGDLLASSSTDGAVLIWNTASWIQQTEIRGHAASVLGLLFAPAGETLITTGQDRVIKVWDVNSGEELLELAGQSDSAAGLSISDQGGTLAASSTSGSIIFWDLLPASESTPLIVSGGSGSLDFHPEGSLLAVPLSDPGRLVLFDVNSGETVFEARSENDLGYTDAVFRPSGSMLAAGKEDGEVELWDLDLGDKAHSLDFLDNHVNQVVFSSDGETLIIAGEDFSVLIWNLPQERVVQEIEIGSSARTIALSPDNAKLAVGTDTGLIYVYDLLSSEQEGLPLSQMSMVTSLVFGHKGDYLIAGSQDGRLVIWDLAARLLISSFEVSANPVTDLAINPEGSLVAAVGADGHVKLFETADWQEVLSLTAGDLVRGPYFGVDFDPARNRLAIAGENAVRFFLLDEDELRYEAETRLFRDFSLQECQRYLHDEDCTVYAGDDSPESADPISSASKKICQITDVGGLQDNAINQNVHRGVISGAERYGWDIEVIETLGYQNLSQYIETAIEAGCDLIITIYSDMGAIAQTFAVDHPQINFLMLDYFSQALPENARAQIYNADQAAFLAGYISASLTETGVVGTFGGVSYPSVTAFMIGFEQGVQYHNAQRGTDVRVVGWDTSLNQGLFIGEFCCFEEGLDLTTDLISQGADIILPVAGPFPGFGALEAARANPGVHIIGVDFDWSGTIPEVSDRVITSVEKRYNVSVLNALADIESESDFGGLYFGTLESGDVGLSPFYGFDSRVSQRLRTELAKIRLEVISGRISTSPWNP